MNDTPIFQLKAEYAPAGDQPAAIAGLVDGLQQGLAHQTLLGVTGSGKTYTIANVIQQVQRPTLVLAHNKTLAAQLYGEFREFFPNNAVEYFVSYYDYYQPEAYVPSSDTFIEKDASINEHIEQMRLSATKALLERPDSIIASRLMAELGLLKVEGDAPARIVVDERSGTIVMGENVRISPVAISIGSLTVKITEDVIVSQPLPRSDGKTVQAPTTDIQIAQPDDPVAILRGPTLEKLVQGLNRMGLKPPEITSILQSIKSAGALQAELVVQ